MEIRQPFMDTLEKLVRQELATGERWWDDQWTIENNVERELEKLAESMFKLIRNQTNEK